jgi:hypothetical protein
MIFAAGRGEGQDEDGDGAGGRMGPANAPPGAESAEVPVQVVAGLSLANGPVGTGVASYPGTAPLAASSRGNPIALQQTAPAPAVASAEEGSDRQTIRTGRGEPHEDALDRIFARAVDGPDDALGQF